MKKIAEIATWIVSILIMLMYMFFIVCIFALVLYGLIRLAEIVFR